MTSANTVTLLLTWRASAGELAGPVTVMRHLLGSLGTRDASQQLSKGSE